MTTCAINSGNHVAWQLQAGHVTALQMSLAPALRASFGPIPKRQNKKSALKY